jgi:hypothetical protein
MPDRPSVSPAAPPTEVAPTPGEITALRRAIRGSWRGQVESLSQEEFDACNDEIAREFGLPG